MAADWLALRRATGVQADLLTRAQCLAAGLTDEFIAHRLRTHRWSRVGHGVYLTKPGRTGFDVSSLVALLAVAEVSPVTVGALQAHPGLAPVVLREESAARAWGMELSRPKRAIFLGVAHTREVATPPDVIVRRIRKWQGVVEAGVFPWRTTKAATIVDCAAASSPDGAIAWLARGVRDGFVTAADLRGELRRRQRVRHGVLMRESLTLVSEGAQSPAEVRYVRDVERRHGLPPALRQASSTANGGSLHDNRYEDYGLVIEVDGRLGHEQWADRVRDGRRDRQLAGRDGVWTSRVFWTDVAVTPCATALEVSGLLQARGWAGKPQPCGLPGCAVARVA